MGNVSSSELDESGRKVKRRALVVSVTLALALVGVLRFRAETNGIRNMFSPSYWTDRMNGRDLYAPEMRFLKAGGRDKKVVSFTFDDGPHPESCPKLLDLLKSENVQVTFFLVGERIKEHPEYVRRMLDEGHEVGNHTQDHVRLDSIRPEQVRRQMEYCELNFERATGSRMHLFRPPGMRYNQTVLDTAKNMGYTTVGWQVGAKDFTGSNVTPELVEQYVMKQIKPGAIILLHDNPITVAAMPAILRRLKAEGYGFETIPQLMVQLPKPIIVASNARTNAKSLTRGMAAQPIRQ